MRTTELIAKLQKQLEKHGDIEVRQLMTIQTPEFTAEKLIDIKKVKYNKKRKEYIINSF